MKKISIVLPTYNGERYIEESIVSVLNQTYENWELIIVDDCSTDGTSAIIQRYARQDSRIRIVRNKTNQKLPSSLNIGFQQATGDYFTWTSDDNYYHKDALEVMLSFLEENSQYGMVYCGVNWLFDGESPRQIDVPKPARYMYIEDPVGACFLYRREVARAVGDYDPDMFLVEDYDYWIQIYKRFKMYYLPECKYTYRMHQASLTRSKAKQVFKQLWRLRWKELEHFLAGTEENEKWYLFLDMWVYHKQEIWDARGKFFPNGELPQKIKWLEKRMDEDAFADDGRPLILFGAGDYGKRAATYFGKERIQCVVDNNQALAGKTMDGIPIISFDQLRALRDPGQIILTVGSRFIPDIVAQLEEAGIKKYELFLEIWLNDGT